MKFKSILLITVLLGLSTCGIVDYLQGYRDSGSIYLVSDEYIKCMQSELPCECAKKNNGYYEMKLDSHFNDDGYAIYARKYNDTIYQYALCD